MAVFSGCGQKNGGFLVDMTEFARPHPSDRLPNVRLRPIDFDTLKSTVPIADLLQSIGWKPVRPRRGGIELRGPCPVHKSNSITSSIFSVTPSRNIFKCFKCGAEGDTIALAAYLFSIPRDQRVKAAVELCKHLGKEIPRHR